MGKGARPAGAADVEIAVDDPRAEDVGALLAAHLAFARGTSPAEYSFALEVEELNDPAVTLFSARRAGVVIGVTALRRLDATHVELKSMHTRQSERGRGVGRAMIEHVLDVARRLGYQRMSLETGTTDDFVAARALYARCGFQPCPPFGEYAASPFNTFMTIRLAPSGGGVV